MMCCVVTLVILLVNTWDSAHDAAKSLKRRGDVAQQLLSTAHGEHGEVAHENPYSDPNFSEQLSFNEGEQHVPLQQQEFIPTSGPESNPKWLFPPDTPAFPSYEKYAALVERSGTLPDIVYIPFEDAVKDDALAGWEVEWLMDGTYDVKKWGLLKEPRIDFIYTWVNGSEEAFRTTKRPYELNSTLNDDEGDWIGKHGENRYRDWNELKYSVRSIEAFAPFRNKIQVLVNSLNASRDPAAKQTPTWLDTGRTGGILEVLTQNDFFDEQHRDCLPTFNSLTIENELHNTESGVDRVSLWQVRKLAPV